MNPIYGPCPCESGMKFKFCCMNKKLGDNLEMIGKLPVHECLMAETGWPEEGLAVIYVSRVALDCRYACACYMVDTFCLGLKNTFSQVNLDREGMLKFRRKLEQRLNYKPYNYEDARSLILGAIEYAGSLGFKPNEDWRDSRHIIEANQPYVAKFEFGKDGKPFYIQGPDDDPESIMKRLATVDHDFLVRAY